MEKKKNIGFHIIKNDPLDGHRGFGKGAVSLDNVSPVIIDVEAGAAFVDLGAMHARSEVEKRIKFTPHKEEAPDGKPYWIVWVTVQQGEDGPYYYGATACEMTVNQETRRGYKSLPEHVNRLDKSLKGHFILDHMDAKSKKVLKDFLESHDKGMWERSSEQLKNSLQ